MKPEELITSFGYWVRRRRKALDLTQAALAQQVGCALVTLKKIEWDERKPSPQMAERLADHLAIPVAQREHFLRMARGEFVTVTLSPSTGVEARLFKHNLPSPPIPFIGRAKELTDIARRLNDPTCRLLTLVGPGGIGKTRLAIQAAQHLVDTQPTELFFGHGIIFVALTPVNSLSGLVAAIAEAANFTFYGDHSPRQQLLDYLREKEMLLVLDNFEQLLSPAERGLPEESPRAEDGRPETFIAEILSGAPGVKILITSREALTVQEAWFHPIDGLSFPGENVAEKALETYDAIQFFVQSARRARVGFSLAAESHSVIRICQLVAGMPLALELAATWLKMLSCDHIAAEIERNLSFLTVGLANVPPRHRSMRAVFEQSWHLLAETEQVVLQRLSIFRGGFQLQAAQEITGASLTTLLGLVNKSLVQRTPAGRFEVHELLRQYTAEKLAQQSSAVCDQHCTYYCTFLHHCEAELQGSRQQTTLAEIEAELENVRTAWHWAARQGYIEQLDQAVFSLSCFYNWRIRWLDGEAMGRLATEKLAAVRSADGLRVQAKILTWQSVFNRMLGRDELARQLLHQGLALLHNPLLVGKDIRAEKAHALWMIGRIEGYSGNIEEGKRALEEGLALSQDLGNDGLVALLLAELGDLETFLGHYEQGRQFYEESLVRYRHLGNQRGIAVTLTALGFNALPQGHFEEAAQLARNYLAIWRALGDQGSLAQGFFEAGQTLIWAGEFAEGCAMLEECLPIYTHLGVRTTVAYIQAWLGYGQCHLGDYKQARKQIEQGLAFLADEPREAITLWFLGLVLMATAAYPEARSVLEESISQFRERGERNELGLALGTLGHVFYRLGDIAHARQYLVESLQVGLDIRAFMPLYATLPVISLLLAEQGQKERAVDLYALLSRYPPVANSHWFDDMFGRHIEIVTATLPAEIVTAAQIRGHFRDVWQTAADLLAELCSVDGKNLVTASVD